MTTENQNRRSSDARDIELAVAKERLDNTIDNLKTVSDRVSIIANRMDALENRVNKTHELFVPKSRFAWIEKLFVGGLMSAVAMVLGWVFTKLG